MLPAPRIVRRVVEDAVELTRSLAQRKEVSSREILQMVVTADAFRVLALNRARETVRDLHIPLLNHALRVAQTAVLGVEIGNDVTLGRGVYFVHPIGIVIGGDSRIGDRVRFYGNNTVGTARDDGYPVLEDDVWVGAGARILGPVRIGQGARIGANAVVLTDVPAGHIAVGVPAVVKPRRASDVVL